MIIIQFKEYVYVYRIIYRNCFIAIYIIICDNLFNSMTKELKRKNKTDSKGKEKETKIMKKVKQANEW